MCIVKGKYILYDYILLPAYRRVLVRSQHGLTVPLSPIRAVKFVSEFGGHVACGYIKPRSRHTEPVITMIFPQFPDEFRRSD